MSLYLNQLATQIRKRKYHHVVLWIGSTVSARGSDLGSTICPAVGTVRDELILKSLQRRVRSMSAKLRSELEPVLTSLLQGGQSRDEKALRYAIENMVPFERFMGCLADAEGDARTAVEIVRLAFHDGVELQPNALQVLIADLVHGLLERQHVERISVVTTNYDRLLECALAPSDSMRLSAWKDAWGFLSDAEYRIPSFQHRAYAPGTLRVFKVHGTIENPKSLVFTMDGLARGIVDPEHYSYLALQLESADLFIFAGYGFNDPDLRPVIARILRQDSGETKRAIRIERGGISDLDPRRGLDTLRWEFLARLPCEEYRCNLFENSPIEEHLVLGLATQLELLRSPPELPKCEWQLGSAAAAVDAVFSRFSNDAAVEFVGRLCDAANSGAAHAPLHTLTFSSPDEVRRPTRVTLLCRSLSHQAIYDDYVQTCRELRAKWRDLNVQLLTLGFEAFAYTIGKPSPLRAMALIRQGRRVPSEGADNGALAVFTHYDGHFWAKMMQYADSLCCVHPWVPLRPLLRPFAQRLARSLHRAAEAATLELDIPFMSEIRDIEAQVWIYAGDLDRALKAATQCENYTAAVGLLNNMALVDRTRGWVYLARNEPVHAQFAFARGTHRSLRSPDVSVWPKLAANLVRVLEADRTISLGSLKPCAKPVSDLVACLERLRDEAHRGTWSADGSAVAEHLLHRFSTEAPVLVKHMQERLNLRRCPVYHPPKPPSEPPAGRAC